MRPYHFIAEGLQHRHKGRRVGTAAHPDNQTRPGLRQSILGYKPRDASLETLYPIRLSSIHQSARLLAPADTALGKYLTKNGHHLVGIVPESEVGEMNAVHCAVILHAVEAL